MSSDTLKMYVSAQENELWNVYSEKASWDSLMDDQPQLKLLTIEMAYYHLKENSEELQKSLKVLSEAFLS